MTEAPIIEQRIALLYRLDREGRLLGANEPCGPMAPAPMAHISIGRSAVAYALRSGLPDALTTRLVGVLASIRPLSNLVDRAIEGRVRDALRGVPGISAIHWGPVYGFPSDLPPSPRVVLVDERNAQVLGERFANLIEELPYVQPCAAALADGTAVATCLTVRVHGQHREAGVETLPEYRRCGYGTEAVSAWGREVIARGRVPTYSTGWDNHGSLGIARRVGLRLIAVEAGIT